MLDDDNTLSGSVRVICEGDCSSGPGVGLTAAYEAGVYTLCMAL
jgi:hypothetical protein